MSQNSVNSNPFHKHFKNESSSDSEEGEVSEDMNEIEINDEINDSNITNELFDSKPLKVSKSLQIIDKINTKNQNRLNIWSDFLMEEELNHCVTNSMDIKTNETKCRQIERHSENYSFWTKNAFEDNSEKDLTQNVNKTKKRKKHKKSKKIKDFNKRDIALEIAYKLHEPKVHLIRKVVETIGESKTSELCSLTLNVESAGGLMTTDGSRRRSPGGVFFHLLKTDPNICKESIDYIFFDEMQTFKQNRKIRKRAKRRLLKKLNKKTNALTVSEDKLDSNDVIIN